MKIRSEAIATSLRIRKKDFIVVDGTVELKMRRIKDDIFTSQLQRC